MNKTYRVIPHKIRHCTTFIGSHVRSRPNGLSPKKTLVNVVGAALLSMAWASASAASVQDIVVSTAETNVYDLQQGQGITIQSSGSIDVSQTGGSFSGAVQVDQVVATFINNAGRIITADTAAAVFVNASDGSSLSSGLVNTGSISAAIGVYMGSTSGGGINNSGTINGTVSGIQVGGLGPVTLSGGITNSGTLTAIGSITSAALALPGAIVLMQASVEGGITNSGTIRGTDVPPDSTKYAAGILGFLGSVDGDITNTGTIDGAIAFGGMSVSGELRNEGTITGREAATYFHALLSDLPAAGLLFLDGTEITGGITNSGVILGRDYSVYATNIDGDAPVVLSFKVAGTSAEFLGDVYAPNSSFTLSEGSQFTNQFAMDVDSILVSAGATFNLVKSVSSSNNITGNVVVSGGVGSFTNMGIVDVGSNGGSAKPTITGRYIQSGGTLKTTVLSDTEYGQLHVTGAVTLENATMEVSVPNTASRLTNEGMLVGVLTSDELIDGQFDAITSSSSIYSFTGLYSTKSVDLLISAKRAAITENVTQYGTPAALGAAAVLDSLAMAPGAMAPVLDTLDGLDGQAQANAVAQTLPVLVGASSMAASQTQTMFNQVMQSRQDQVSGASSGEAFAGNRSVWGKAFGGWANQGDLNNVAGYSVDSGGLAFGFDKQISPKSNLGLAVAYAYSSVKSKSSAAPSSVDVNSFQLGVYGDYQIEPTLQLNYQVDGAINTNSSTRSLSSFAGAPGIGANANGSYNSYVGHVGLGLKKFFNLSSSTRLTPEVRLDYMTVQSDGYTETGGGPLNLNVSSQTYNTLYTSVGFRVDHLLSNGLNLTADVGVGYNALDTKAQVTSAYQGGGASFVTNGLDVSPWLYTAGLGVSGMVSKNVELNVRYDIDFTNTSYTNQMISARVKVLF